MSQSTIEEEKRKREKRIAEREELREKRKAVRQRRTEDLKYGVERLKVHESLPLPHVGQSVLKGFKSLGKTSKKGAEVAKKGSVKGVGGLYKSFDYLFKEPKTSPKPKSPSNKDPFELF